MYVHIYVCMCVYVHVYVCVCIYVYVYSLLALNDQITCAKYS